MLGKITLFEGLGNAETAELERFSVVRTYPRNAVILNEGDHSESLYLILEGRVKIYLSDENGKEIIINEQGEGEYFGELALIDDVVRSASVMTMQECRFYIISKAGFQKAMSSHPGIALIMLKNLSARVRSLTDNVKSLALLDVYGRVAKTLLSLASEEGGRLVVQKVLTQQDIADRVGASRKMVACILKNLTRDGYIALEQRRIVITSPIPGFNGQG